MSTMICREGGASARLLLLRHLTMGPRPTTAPSRCLVAYRCHATRSSMESVSSSAASRTLLRSSQASTSMITPLVIVARRHSGSGDPNRTTDLAIKSTATMVVENRDAKVYTMQQYFEKETTEEANKLSLLQRLDRGTDNPIWMLWGLGFIGISVLFFVVTARIRRERIRFDPMMRKVRSFDMPGGPQIGGPFTLRDVDGNVYTNESFLGKWMFIYFGFTNCPDICPQEMQKMTRLIRNLDKKVGKDYWQPLFISIDPKRDTPEKLKEYLADFHPRLLGLTGTMEQCEAAAREYRVFFAVSDEFAEDAPDYLVDHSIVMYLMDPEGKFCDYTTKEFTWHEVYTKLLRRMIDYERQRPPEVANLKVANAVSVADNTDIKKPA